MVSAARSLLAARKLHRPGALVTTVPGRRGAQGQVEAGAEPGRALRVLEAPQKRSAESAAFGVFGGLPQFYRGGC